MVIEYRGEIRILKELLKIQETNINDLAKRVGQTNKNIWANVNRLQKKEIVTVRLYGKDGRVKIIGLNKRSPYYEAINKLWG